MEIYYLRLQGGHARIFLGFDSWLRNLVSALTSQLVIILLILNSATDTTLDPHTVYPHKCTASGLGEITLTPTKFFKVICLSYLLQQDY